MSIWTEQWSEFVRETSYMHILREQNISNDQFWEIYQAYDEMLRYAGYPGEILSRVSSFIPSGSTFLDVGAGTGAFAIPLSKKMKKTIAVDPSEFQLKQLMEKAEKEGLDNIDIIVKEWGQVASSDLASDLSDVDFSLASYSFFDEDIEGFLLKMLKVSLKGVFLVFRAGEYDSLSEFAYGRSTSVDFKCLLHILDDLGYSFKAEIFKREYSLPMDLVFRQFGFSKRSPAELTEHLRERGRLRERVGEDDGGGSGDSGSLWALFSSDDALLYYLC
jgi:ubiquinone/menaquinone biosynthesis C-methylase UbiE